MTLIGDVVPDDDGRARASGLGQSVGYTAAILGPPLAAPLLFSSGVEWALVINALSFIASFLFIRAIRVPAVAAAPVTADVSEAAATTGGAERRFLSEFVDGLKFVWRNAVVRVIMITIVILTLGSGALNALMLFFTTDNLHVGAGWYGTIGMGEGIGAVVGALTGAWICRRIGDTRVVGVALVLLGLGIFVLAQLHNLVATIALLALLGLPLGALNVAIMPILLRSVPREVLGRVGGILNPTQYLASMVSALLAGWLVSTVLRGVDGSLGPIGFDPINSVFMVCGVMFLISAAYAWTGLRAAAAAPAVEKEPAPAEV
jgi:MFS family permease